MAAWDGDPTTGSPLQVVCDEDTGPAFCAEISVTALPASGELWIGVDEWTPQQWWDGASTREVVFELIP